MKKLLLQTFAAAALIGFGCSASTEFDEDAPHNKPIKNTEVKDTISFQKAINEIPPTEVIGGVYKDLIKIKVKEFYAVEITDDKYQRIYEDVILYELTMAGYNCVSKNTLFDTVKSQSRFLLGAVITDARLNSYVIASKYEIIIHEYNSDALLDIRWELYDTKVKKVIYSCKELGTTKKAESTLDAYRQAVRISFRNFLAEKELLDAIKKHLLN